MLDQAFRIEILAKALNERLNAQKLVSIFSSSKNDLYFGFETTVLHLVFYRGQAFWLIADADRLPGANRMPQFRTVRDVSLIQVVAHRYDRSYSFVFPSGHALHFLHYGRNSRVIHTDNDIILGSFPPAPFESDVNFTNQPPRISREFLDQLQKDNLRTKMRFLNDEQQKRLESMGFFNTDKRFELWEEFVSHELSMYPVFDPQGGQLTWGTEKTRVLEELDAYARIHLRQQRFQDLYRELSRNLNKDLERKLAKYNSLDKSLQQKEGTLSYRQKADILMANVHRNDVSGELECHDFYHDKPVKIRLKTGLSIQENATRLYRKAKQEYRELNELATRKEKLASEIAELRAAVAELESATDYRTLSKLEHKTSSKNTGPGNTPSNKHIFYQGFEIRVGGNSKQNEQILREARKEDIWLHAREHSGAHVLIRLNREQNVPEHILEFAASLAAWNSKARSEHLAAVIYTRRKFVRKFKGAETGQVKVDRESTLMVEPEFWKTCLADQTND